ncbi:MAG: MEDS domain-containing protein [Acidobacteriota bacterium]|nr:MEDS domain-containing protein [Acidobacteriota bacterium]
MDGIAHGDHVCAVFDGPAIQQEVLAQYVESGLGRDERVVYYTDDDSPDRVLGMLRAGGVATAEPCANGQLVVLGAREGYLSEPPFEPGRMIASLHAAVDDALADGFNGFCATGELSSPSREAASVTRMLEYEAQVSELCATRPAMGLCQYDTRRFDGPLIERMRELHGYEVRKALVSSGGLLRIVPLAGDLHGNVRLKVIGEADLSSSSLLLAALDDETQSGGDVHLNLGRLRFIDLKGIEALRALSDELNASQRRLVLHSPPRILRRIAELVRGCLPGVEIPAP